MEKVTAFALTICLCWVMIHACPGGWVNRAVSNESSCYLFMNNARLSWLAALSYCKANDARLITLETHLEVSWIDGYLQAQNVTGEIWIGGYDDHAGQYRWYAGGSQPDPLITASNWHGGQPNRNVVGGINQACVRIVPSTTYKWIDRLCGDKKQFICEK